MRGVEASAITPMVVAWPVMSAISGRILPRVGFRPLVWTGLAVSAVGAIALAALLSPTMTLSVPRATTAVFGAGLGLANTALIIAVQSSVGWEQRGVATASTMFFRTIGGTVALGALGGILSRALAHEANVPPDAANLLLGPDHGRTLPRATLDLLSGVLSTAMASVFWVIAAIALAAFAVILLFPSVPVPLRRAPEAPGPVARVPDPGNG